MHHDRYLAERDPLLLFVDLNEVLVGRTGPVAVATALLNPEINVRLDHVCQVADARLVRVVRVHLASSLITQCRLRVGVDLGEDSLEADVLIVLDGLAGDELAVDLDEVGLVLAHAVGDRVLDKLVERLDLLVDDAVLLEERVDDLPLVVDVDLVLATVLLDARLRVQGSAVLTVRTVLLGSLWFFRRRMQRLRVE